MEYFINCNNSSLAQYNTPLDKTRVEHLYRRLGFSASVQTINAAVGQSANALVDTFINDAINAAPDIYNNCNSFLYYYVNCLQRNAIGNFRTFVSEIGLTSAMLRYLDGVFNYRQRPNENYARELYELFTLGEGNGYTEDDIVETAKALTGYTERGEVGCTQITYDPETFNTDDKTIFGQTGNWGYDDVIDILFTQKEALIANFICMKLYEFFVHPDSSDANSNAPQIISELATTFVANNFELAPVLSQLFKSEHFFDEAAIGVIIKSPMETFVQLFYQADTEQFRTLGIQATGPTGATESDPDVVARAIIDKFLPKGLLTEADYTVAITAFREPYEDNNVYETGTWNMMLDDADSQVYLLLLHLVKEPEFQLK